MTRALSCLALLLACYAPAYASNLEVNLLTKEGKPAEDAAIVIEPIKTTPPKRRTNATIAQQDREFTPYVTIVQTGTTIDFPNRDPIKHHLYSFSPAKSFEVKLYADKPSQPIVFEKPGEVALGCNIHDWMEAYVLVVDTPYFAKTNSKGRARITNIPPGNYRLKIWHPRQKVELPARDISIGTAPTKLALTLDIAPRMIKAKPPVDAGQY